jgi:hypothetical protein
MASNDNFRPRDLPVSAPPYPPIPISPIFAAGRPRPRPRPID